MAITRNSSFLHTLFRFFSLFRIIAFFSLIGFLCAKYFLVEPISLWFAAAYPIALILSWLFLKLIYYKKYPNMASPFISAIIMADIVTPLFNVFDARKAARVWNIWHFRNRKKERTVFEIIVAWIIRIIVVAVIAAIIVAFI